jgi:hypothetical protein
MTIKYDNNLDQIVRLSGKSVEEVVKVIVNAIKETKVLPDDPDFYGLEISDCVEDLTRLYAFCNIVVLDLFPRAEMTANSALAIASLKLFGESDCPACGGEMQVTDGEYKLLGDGYNEAFEKGAPIWEEKQCRCGHKETV